MNILIFCHHLSTWAGSETVCLELVEEFQSRGHRVKISSPFASPKFVHEATRDWRVLQDGISRSNLQTIDLILVLHQGLSTLTVSDFEVLFARTKRPYIAYFHLSPFEPFELPGPFVESALADVIYANSEETRHELKLHGLHNVKLFQNPAPACFELGARENLTLQTLLSISNHMPTELAEAFEILKTEGVEVRRIGRPSNNRRVTPDDIEQCDAVVTIGKSVQYSFRSRRPVFCYDHFQGPGWLAPWTQEDEQQNFSGRSSQITRSAEAIAAELLHGYSNAKGWVSENDAADLKHFQLEYFVDQLLEAATDQREAAWADWTQKTKWKEEFRTERNLYHLVNREYAKTKKLYQQSPFLKSENGRFEKNLNRKMLRQPDNDEPMVIAVFSFRYDAHLVPDLIENIGPSIHGYASFDDRLSTVSLSNEANRQYALYAAAREMGADWIFAVDPDERFERSLTEKMAFLTSQGPVIWTFECREMFNAEEYRADGIWSNRPRQRLFPCYPGMEPDKDRLHGLWSRNALELPTQPSGLEYFHLRMASPERRTLRQRLYADSDPDRNFQKIGYDYIDDERGQKLYAIPESRKFVPPFVDDGGLWGVDTDQFTLSADSRDPLPHSVRRLIQTLKMGGYENAMHLAQELLVEHPNDLELALLCAQSALLAESPRVTCNICQTLTQKTKEPLLALRLLAQAFLNMGLNDAAEDVITKIDTVCPKFDCSDDLKQQLCRSPDKFYDPDATWRRWLPSSVRKAAFVHTGKNVNEAQIAVVVVDEGNAEDLATAVASLRSQSVSCEIVVVHSGSGSAKDALVEHLDAIRLVSVETRINSGAARNVGIDASEAKFIAFLSSNYVATEGWLEERLATHLKGYAAVPSYVHPIPGSSQAALATWVWLCHSNIVPTLQLDHNAFSLSYDRELFMQFGYFPIGTRIGHDTALLDRFSGLVDIAQDVDKKLMQVTPSSKDAIQRCARYHMMYTLGAEVNDADQLRTLVKTQVARRLARAQCFLTHPSTAELKDLDNDALDFFALARLEEQAAIEAGLEVLKAKALKNEAEALLQADPEKAIDCLEEAMRLWPDSAELCFFAAKCCQTSKSAERRQASIDMAMSAFSIDPDLVEAIAFAVATLVSEKQFERAFSLFKWAVLLNPASDRLALVARHLPGPNFRPIRLMFFQRAFFQRPWSRQSNNHLISIYKNLDENTAAESRKSLLSKF